MIRITGISKTYGGVRAVRDVSFTLRDGQVTGFLGPNGAGKSTTMKMVCGVETPDAGACLIDGREPGGMARPMRALGVLLDGQGALPGMRARDYLLSVAAPAGIPSCRVDELLRMVGLSAASRRRVGTFSLGMRQRLGLAVALLGDPRNVVLDEPINGLDPDGVIWVRGLLRDLAGHGRCVFLSSHLMGELELCVDRLLVIDHGVLLRDGTLREVIDDMESTILVRSADDRCLLEAMRRAGARVQTDRGNLVVTGIGIERIGDISIRERIPLHLLQPRHASLEEAYETIIRHEGDTK